VTLAILDMMLQEQESSAPQQQHCNLADASRKSPRRTSKFARRQATIPALRDAGQNLAAREKMIARQREDSVSRGHGARERR